MRRNEARVNDIRINLSTVAPAKAKSSAEARTNAAMGIGDEGHFPSESITESELVDERIVSRCCVRIVEVL